MFMIFYSFPGFQGLSYVRDLTSYSLSYVFIAFRARIRYIYYFINNDQSDSLEAYGWHFRGTQLKGLTWVAKSTWCIREYAWDLQHDDYDGNADPGVCFIRKIHNEISQKSTQMHCGQNDLVALQAYQILTIEQR